MPAPLKLRLTEEEDQKLFELRTAPGIPKRTRQRAEALRLLASGWEVGKIATYLDCAPQTVRQARHRWLMQGCVGLWDAPRQGRKPGWQPADIEYLEECLDKEQLTYNTATITTQAESPLGQMADVVIKN